MTQARFNFQTINSQQLRFNTIAYNWLSYAAKDFGGIVTLENDMRLSDSGQAKIIVVYSKKAILLRGVFVVVFTQQEFGKVMTLTLLGGEDINEWKDELSKYLYKLAKDNDIDQFFYMGRKGFSKIFPELKECARVYRVILK